MSGPTKVCLGCAERKPWSAYYPNTRWPDGSTRTPMSRCIPCERARRTDYYRQRKETEAVAARERMRAYRARLAADPAAFSEYRRRENEYSTTHRRKLGARPRPSAKRIRESLPDLPGRPLALAVDRIVARDYPDLMRQDGILTSVLERAGLHERTYRAWLYGEREGAGFDHADRVMTNLGLLWWEVYPPDEFPEVAEIFEPEAVAA